MVQPTRRRVCVVDNVLVLLHRLLYCFVVAEGNQNDRCDGHHERVGNIESVHCLEMGGDVS